jgi:hypothetical protein
LDIDKATPSMLAEKFRAVGAEGQVLQKCLTFYISAMRNAGWQVSPHLIEKAPRQKRDRNRPPRQNHESEPRGDGAPAPGIVRFSFPIPDKAAATIILPAELTADDWEMVNNMVSAYISRREKR